MIVYEWKTTEDGDPIECECCNSDVPVANLDLPRPTNKNPLRRAATDVCEICASSYGSNYWGYTSLYSEDLQKITAHQTFCTNQLLKQMGKWNKRAAVESVA